MTIGSLPVFKVAREKMQYLNARQVTLAQNVANVDTPGYIGRDLKAPDFKRMAMGQEPNTSLKLTKPNHLPMLSVGGSGGYQASEMIDDEANPDGSRVQLDDQLKRVAETQMQYNIAVNVYRKQIALFRTALGSGQG